jgi:hypothetical protein
LEQHQKLDSSGTFQDYWQNETELEWNGVCCSGIFFSNGHNQFQNSRIRGEQVFGEGFLLKLACFLLSLFI